MCKVFADMRQEEMVSSPSMGAKGIPVFEGKDVER